jgi:hypothetical protein
MFEPSRRSGASIVWLPRPGSQTYDSQARRQVLTAAGIVDAVMYRRHPGRRPAWQKYWH